MAGTTDLIKLQEDVVLQSKSVKGHLNVTMNEVHDENFTKPDMSATDKFPEKVVDQENQPPLDKSVEQAADDTKDLLFCGNPEYAQESDYFATDGEAGSSSPVFRADDGNKNAQVDTSNEIICPTQRNTGSDPISTVGLVEVEALSSPMVPSRQPQHDENVNAIEQSDGQDDKNSDCLEEGVDNTFNYDPDDSTNEDPFPLERDITSQPFPEYNIPVDVNREDNGSVDSGIHSSSSVLHEHDTGVDGDGHEHDVDGSEHEQVGGAPTMVNEEVIYNQEVITLNRNMDVKKNLGSDCVVQAQGESKLVISVQSNLEKMKLVQKLFKESACFKGWSSELQKIPLVELDRCKVELVTEKNYKKYVTTVDGSLDVLLKGGDGADGTDKEEPIQSVPATQTSHDNSDGHDTTLNAPFEEDEPTLESLFQVAHAKTGHQPNCDGNNEPLKPLRHQIALKRTANSTKPSKKPKTSDNRNTPASDALDPKPLPTVKPRESKVGKRSKTTAEEPAKSKKQSRSKKSDGIEQQEAEHELLLEALMHLQKDDGNGNTNDEFSMDDYHMVVNI